MARGILKVFFVVTLATIFQSHFGMTLHVQVDPENFNEVVTDELVISCLDNGTIPMVKQMVMLELWKKDESPLVIVREDNLTSGPGIRSNMKATGHIEKDASRSYLKLTIKNPGIEDAGTYSCKIFYLNDLYQLKEASAFGRARITVDKTDITEVVTYLMGKLNILEKTTKQQEELIAKQSAVIQGQESTLKRQEEQLVEHQEQLKTQMEKATFTTAFSYRYNTRNNITNSQVVIFSDKIMEVGNNYNTSTGRFTAPRDGLYSFHITARTETGGLAVNIYLYHNWATTAILNGYSGSTNKQSSTSALVSMKAGDTIWPQSYTSIQGNILYAGFSSKFTGHLIKLL